MRSRKELIYLIIEDLCQDEIDKLGDYELNCCDKCGQIDLNENLNWIDQEGWWDIKELDEARKEYVALCNTCLEEIIDSQKIEN